MEALERRGKTVAIAAILLMVFLSQLKVAEGRNSTKMSYVCPPQFIRLGHSCYFFSENKATWQNALFACKDRDSNLTVPARWEDRNLRNYLNKPDVFKVSRWIGGIYDVSARAWKWGGELRSMRYQSFSKMKKLSPEELQWHCIAMIPELLYRWAPRSCIEPRQYICQTKLRKVPKSKVKEFGRRWQKMGKINEITAPSVSREVNDPLINEVTVNPKINPKSYDLRPSPLRLGPKYETMSSGSRLHAHARGGNVRRPNELTKRSRAPRPTARRRLTRPFPGYSWNRRDPEGSYQRNAELLRSGKTGLSPQQVQFHLGRLERLRDKQAARRMRLLNRTQSDAPPRPLVQTHARTYTIDNNISALHPKTIVEEFDMLPPPPPPPPPSRLVLPRPARGTG